MAAKTILLQAQLQFNLKNTTHFIAYIILIYSGLIGATMSDFSRSTVTSPGLALRGFRTYRR